MHRAHLPLPDRSRTSHVRRALVALLAAVGVAATPLAANAGEPDFIPTKDNVVVVHEQPGTLDDYWDIFFEALERTWWDEPWELVPIRPEDPGHKLPDEGGSWSNAPEPPEECNPHVNEMAEIADNLAKMQEAQRNGKVAAVRNGKIEYLSPGDPMYDYYRNRMDYQIERLRDQLDRAYEDFWSCFQANT